MKRKILIIGIGALGLVSACNNQAPESDAYGNFEVTEVTVSAEWPGKLLTFTAEEGSTLQAGRSLGWVDTTDLALQKKLLLSGREKIRAGQAEVKALMAVQQQQLANLQPDLKRLKNLLAQGAATQKQWDDLEGKQALLTKQVAATRAKLAGLKSEWESLDVKVEQVEARLRKCQIVNPMQGTVLNRFAEAGEMVGNGLPLYTIAGLDKMTLRVFVDEKQLSDIALGQKVRVFVDRSVDGLRELEGRVEWISERSEFTPKIIQTRQERVKMVYAIKIGVVNDGRLKIGMPAEVRF